jgi:hypothetical protein
MVWRVSFVLVTRPFSVHGSVSFIVVISEFIRSLGHLGTVHGLCNLLFPLSDERLCCLELA